MKLGLAARSHVSALTQAGGASFAGFQFILDESFLSFIPFAIEGLSASRCSRIYMLAVNRAILVFDPSS